MEGRVLFGGADQESPSDRNEDEARQKENREELMEMDLWQWAGLTVTGLFILYLAVRLAGKAWHESKKDFIADIIRGRGGTKDGEEKETEG